jgi:hypothetical protein
MIVWSGRAGGRGNAGRQRCRRLRPGDSPVQAIDRLAAILRGSGVLPDVRHDGLLEDSPAEHVRRPAVSAESPTLGFTHLQFGALLTGQERRSRPFHRPFFSSSSAASAALDRRRSWQRLLLRQVLNAAEVVIPDYGSYLFLIPAFECPDELRMLSNRFPVRQAGLGPARKRPPQ